MGLAIKQLWLPIEMNVVESMRLTDIPMPPSSNNLYATFARYGNIRRIKATHYVDWQKQFADWCLQNYTELSAVRGVISEMRKGQVITIHTDFYFKAVNVLTKKGTPKRNDSSNRIKALHDAVAEAIYIDDCYFWNGTFSKYIIFNDIQDETCNVELKIIDLPQSST